jgi:hypothetical protein
MTDRWGARIPNSAVALVDGRIGFTVSLSDDDAASPIESQSVLGSFDHVETALARLGVQRLPGAHWKAVFGGWRVPVEPLE